MKKKDTSEMQMLFDKSSFGKEALQLIFEDAPVTNYKKNEVIYDYGEMVTEVYVVISGLVELYVTNENGAKQTMAYHYPDSLFGDVPSVIGHPAFLICKAAKTSTIKHLNKNIFLERIKHLNLEDAFFQHLALKTEANCRQLAAISLENCEERLQEAYYTDLTHQQIGELMACSRVQVTRVFNKYHNQKEKDENH
jgi:CRP-like cAMP-binding protein